MSFRFIYGNISAVSLAEAVSSIMLDKLRHEGGGGESCFSFGGGQRSEPALLSVGFSVSVFWCTLFSFSSCHFFFALFNFFLVWNVFYKPLSSSLWNILDAQSPEGLKKSSHFCSIGGTLINPLLSPLSGLCCDRTELGEPIGWGRGAKEGRNRQKVVLYQPATGFTVWGG